MSRRAFMSLSPRSRGRAVYLLGAREDEPNVPDERNPYATGSRDAAQWDAGAWSAYLDVIDADDE